MTGQQYLAKELEWYQMVAAQDPKLISATAKAKQGDFAVKTGIMNVPDPGKVRWETAGAGRRSWCVMLLGGDGGDASAQAHFGMAAAK